MTRNIRSIFLLLILAVVFLCVSCVHTTPLKDRMYIQSFGTDGQFVITVDSSRFNFEELANDAGIEMSSSISYLTDKMTRFSIVLFDKSGQYLSYPADFSTMDFEGSIEGDYSKTVLNTVLKTVDTFEKAKGSSGLKYFVDTQTGLEISIPSNGIILFSSSDVENNYNLALKTSDKVISDEIAQKLSSCAIGIYVSNPKTMLDVGLDIPQSSLENIEYVLMTIDEDILSCEFKLKNDSLAKSFSVLIKASYVGDLRREGLPIDIKMLKEQFVQEFDLVYIKDLNLSDKQQKAIKAVALQLLDLLN